MYDKVCLKRRRYARFANRIIYLGMDRYAPYQKRIAKKCHINVKDATQRVFVVQLPCFFTIQVQNES